MLPSRPRLVPLLTTVLCVVASLRPTTAVAQAKAAAPARPDTGPPAAPFDRLKFRSIGPAAPSGRIDDFAVFEKNPAVFYVATATGGSEDTNPCGMSTDT